MTGTNEDLHDARELFERFLALPAENRDAALSGAASLVAEVLGADKVDAFLHDAERSSLVAVGTSDQPLSRLQRAEGLDVLALANGGSCVRVFLEGTPFLAGRLREDRSELAGIRDTLCVESQVAARLEIAGKPIGVLCAASQARDRWTERDVRLIEAIGRWVTIVAHRAELIAELERAAHESGRRAAAEELVTTAAHDLRNFFAPLMLRLSALRRRAERDGRMVDLQDIDPSLNTLRRMEGLVTDLLDAARIDHGLFELETQSVELAALLDDVASALSGTNAAVQVEGREPVWADVDPLRLRQCIENIVANALKYGSSGGSVHLTLSSEQREDGCLASIEISDQGPGIPAHLLPHVFERFVTDKQARSGGLGLGLFLAKRIVTLHGGELTVASQPGRGTRFLLTLPCRREPS